MLNRVLHGCAVFVLSVAVVGAQDPEPTGQEPKPPPIPVEVEGKSFPLELLDAMRLGIRNNTSLRITEILPYQIAEDVRAARAIFEPELFADVTASSSQDPDRIFQAAGFAQPAVTRTSYRGSFGVRQLVPSGGLFDLALSPSKFRQSNSATGSTTEFGSDVTITLTQPLLRGAWSDYTLREVHTQETLRAAAEHRYQRAVQDTLIAVVEAYWNLVFARGNYQVVVEALDLAQQQLDRTNRKIQVGELAPLDRVADEAEVARRREELVNAETEIFDRQDDLRRLLFDDRDGELWLRNLEPTTPIGEFPRSSALDWQPLSRVARRVRPDLRARRAEVAAAEISRDAAETDVLPRLDLIGSYTSDGVAGVFSDAWGQTAGVDFPDWSLQLQLSVPIGNNAALALRDRARLEVERTQRILYSEEIDVTLEVREAVRQLRTLAETILRGAESVRLAETNLEREVARKEAGTSTTFEVQQRNQELQEARSRLLRNRLDYRIAEARLRYAQGTLGVDPDGPDGGEGGTEPRRE